MAWPPSDSAIIWSSPIHVPNLASPIKNYYVFTTYIQLSLFRPAKKAIYLAVIFLSCFWFGHRSSLICYNNIYKRVAPLFVIVRNGRGRQHTHCNSLHIKEAYFERFIYIRGRDKSRNYVHDITRVIKSRSWERRRKQRAEERCVVGFSWKTWRKETNWET